MKREKRNCLSCNQEFIPQRPNRKYCCNACRTRDYRRRKELGIQSIPNKSLGVVFDHKLNNESSEVPGIINKDIITKDGHITLDAYMKKIEEYHRIKVEYELLKAQQKQLQKQYEKDIQELKENYISKISEIDNKKGHLLINELVKKFS